MTGKTKKDLESENTLLKQENDNLKNKLVEIYEKYENLQTKGKPTTFVKRNKILRCEQFFESLTDLKDHEERIVIHLSVISVTKNLMKNGNCVPIEKS